VSRARAKQDEIDAKKPDRACLQCGDIIAKNRRSDAKFCSPECNGAAHKLLRSLRSRGGPGGEHGYIRLEIAERDRWRCGICEKPVSQSARYPDPMVASLDHVIPVSQGGTSVRANLRLAHLQCNVRRRDGGGGEQLALH
jgi:5-methylcytosine-specific restriction endonuclease McrA